MLTVRCSTCGESYEVDRALEGQTMRCRECKESLRIPHQAGSASMVSEPRPTTTRQALFPMLAITGGAVVCAIIAVAASQMDSAERRPSVQPVTAPSPENRSLQEAKRLREMQERNQQEREREQIQAQIDRETYNQQLLQQSIDELSRQSQIEHDNAVRVSEGRMPRVYISPEAAKKFAENLRREAEAKQRR